MSHPRRLDEILRELGSVSEAQIALALHAQRAQGGRLGSHLMRIGALGADELVDALALQYGVPAFRPGRHGIDRELVRRVPRETLLRTQVMPVRFNASNGVLDVVAVDPGDGAAVAAVSKLIPCADTQVSVTPETVFAALVDEHAPAAPAVDGGRPSIVLPDLFAASAPEPEPGPGDEALPRVLLVTRRVFLSNVLGPVFEREGYRLVAAADRGSMAAHLGEGGCVRVLVGADLAADVRGWIERREVPRCTRDLVEFDTVSAALLDNPAPYAAMFGSLVQALRLAAEARESGRNAPPYERMLEDVRGLGGALGLGRLAVDGLQLAVLLIAADPDAPYGIAWERTTGAARALAFPWDVAAALDATRELLGERVNLAEIGARASELAMAAQALAVVWHYRTVVEPAADAPRSARSALRARSGLLAVSELVETYISLIDRDEQDGHEAARHQLVVVGAGDPGLERAMSRLRHLGYPVVPAVDIEEMVRLCTRRPPSAVLVHESVGVQALAEARVQLGSDQVLRLYAMTGASDPSRVLDLLDMGFDEVFVLPRDLDLLAVRLRRSLQAAPAPAAGIGGFGAPFSAMPFMDLLQALSQSLRSATVDLAGPDGAVARVRLERGRLVHAICGEAAGAAAVHAVIRWRDQGRFTVIPAGDVAECVADVNVQTSLESILMEGCRLLDESLA